MHRLIALTSFALFAGNYAFAAPDSVAIDGKAFVKHIQILASDAFEGRKPFTEGEKKTVAYLKAEFQKAGLQPGNGKSYFQDVPMVNIASTPAGPLVLKGKTGTVSLANLTDFVATTPHVQNQVRLNDSEMVFVGYGIVAPEYNWNDYAGLDVKGKTVVVMVNDPGMIDSTLFKGNIMTYYGRWTYKYEEAARQGAAGVLIVHESKAASYGWSVIRSSFAKSKMYLQTADNNKSRAVLEGWITQDAAKNLFKLAGVSPELLREAGVRGFKPVKLGVTTSLVIDNQITKSTSQNVLALLPGTTRRNEYIVYTSHWDHLGKSEAIKGDSIYNGASDNASGTAALLELAETFAKLKKKPARSILFLAVTAEEQGLLGSEYYATHPVFPLDKTVANINMDAFIPLGRTKDVVLVGKGQSDLEDYAAAIAARQGRTIRGDFNPSAGSYFRSDHFNFAKVGVPALYLKTGVNSVKNGETWGKAQLEDHNLNRYHAPSDEYSPSWDLSGIIEDMNLLFAVGYQLSNESTFPGWKTGSEFKAIREKSKK
ncbi:M28 family metallopeptidase [Larkinella terrae]|uniref:M20/M25/M40 family metallo-hydrolase n=1 Tax=Larkinella terrae TaxID=2025311 RepID=A0A7K0EHL1_9BACT|nr:M28 family metallopeptidase [Larkinella terrae]MRS61202.1 M20/M25/M40 family metallo-hydrolase [Larkinella terrae]